MTRSRIDLGERGERHAAAHLEAAGYQIVDRNFRARDGELDIVALDGGCIVFCEVKSRVARRAASALEAVGPQKRTRLRRLAARWLAVRAGGLPPGSRPDVRFDAIGVAFNAAGEMVALEHVEGAF